MLPALPLDEKELLLKFQSGDSYAFTSLYQLYYPKLYLHAYNRLRDREVAKDLIQDLFTNLWAKHETLQIQDGLSSYLYRSVRNRVIDYIARQKLNSTYIKSFGKYLTTPDGNTDHLLRERQLAALIDSEIEKLPPQVKKIFELSRKDNLSHKEIAAQLSISEQTVRWNVKSALKILRMRFGLLILIAVNSIL